MSVRTRAFAFVVTPADGGGAAPDAVVPVARLLREAGARVDVTYSPRPRAAAALVDQAVARGDVVVAVGGDRLVASVAAHVGAGDGTLALLPSGPGQDLAHRLDLPADTAGLAGVLLGGGARRVDLLAAGADGCGAGRLVAGSVRAAVAPSLRDRLPRSGGARVEVDGVPHDLAGAELAVTAAGDGLLRVGVGPHLVLTGSRVRLAASRAVPVRCDGVPVGPLPSPGGPAYVVEVRPGALSVLA